MADFDKDVWDLSELFASDGDPAMEDEKKKVEEVVGGFVVKWKNRDDYLGDPKVLKEALDEYEDWARNFGIYGKAGFYWGLRNAADQNDPKVKAQLGKILEFGNRMQNEIQFFVLRVAKIPETEQKKFLDFAGLGPYKHFLERLFVEAKYQLSEPEEKIVNLKSITSHHNWERMTSSLLSKEEREVLINKSSKDKNPSLHSGTLRSSASPAGLEKYKKEKKNFSQIYNLINDQDKRVRDTAALAMNDILVRWVDVGEAEINSLLQNKKTDDELRKMERPDLARHLADDIDSAVVDNVVAAVEGHYQIPHKYYELKAKLFGVPKLAYHERTVPYGKIEKKYNFSEAVGLVEKVFGRLDGGFADIFLGIVERRQVDVYPRKGKQSGAFCSSDLLIEPTYVLLNFSGKVKNVATIAHEFGHGINDSLMRERQNSLNFHTPLSTAEVASTFMEDFVFEEILRGASEELRLAILMMKLDEDVGTIFRQTAFYLFEKRLHQAFRQKGYLPKEEIGEMFLQESGKMMGPFVELSPGSENWWLYVPHFRNFFYVYSYASGQLISKSLQAAVKKDPRYIDKVKEFLAAGSSDSPKNIFLKLGIDISDKEFWEKGISEVEKLLTETEKLAKKLRKI